jgi:hypothetical protein
MNADMIHRAEYELRFQSFSDPARALAFPCDASGRVDMDALCSRTRNNYLYARAVMGWEFSQPSVRTCTSHYSSADYCSGSRNSRVSPPEWILKPA